MSQRETFSYHSRFNQKRMPSKCNMGCLMARDGLPKPVGGRLPIHITFKAQKKTEIGSGGPGPGPKARSTIALKTTFRMLRFLWGAEKPFDIKSQTQAKWLCLVLGWTSAAQPFNESCKTHSAPFG